MDTKQLNPSAIIVGTARATFCVNEADYTICQITPMPGFQIELGFAGAIVMIHVVKLEPKGICLSCSFQNHSTCSGAEYCLCGAAGHQTGICARCQAQQHERCIDVSGTTHCNCAAAGHPAMQPKHHFYNPALAHWGGKFVRVKAHRWRDHDYPSFTGIVTGDTKDGDLTVQERPNDFHQPVCVEAVSEIVEAASGYRRQLIAEKVCPACGDKLSRNQVCQNRSGSCGKDWSAEVANG